MEYLHVKDAVLGERGNVALPGAGDGRIPKLFEFLRKRGFSGFASLELHLFHADETGGYTGRDGFRAAAQAPKHILQNEKGRTC